MKLRVKKGAILLYPDGSVRGLAGYVVDSARGSERATIREQGDKLERIGERQTPASPVDLLKLAGSVDAPAEPAAPAADKPVKKKVVRKKKAVRRKAD